MPMKWLIGGLFTRNFQAMNVALKNRVEMARMSQGAGRVRVGGSPAATAMEPAGEYTGAMETMLVGGERDPAGVFSTKGTQAITTGYQAQAQPQLQTKR